MIKRDLVARWNSVEGRHIAEDAAFRLLSGEPFRGSSVATIDGKVDLRGFSLPAPERVRILESGGFSGEIVDGIFTLRSAHWEGIDLSYSRLESLRFLDSSLADCEFEGVNARDWRLWNSVIHDCNFSRADMRDAALGTWHNQQGNTWERVMFASADLRGASFEAARLIDCDFAQSKLGSMHFSQCLLHGVRFAGVLQDVLFDCREVRARPDPGPLVSVDFSQAEFRDVDFRGCRFDDVVFPKDQSVHLVPFFPALASREADRLSGDSSLEARQVRAVLESQLANPGREDSTGVFVREDWSRAGGEPLARLAERTFLAAIREID